MSTYRILLGDCREVLAAMDGESVDAIVTDPPYGLAFMGKRWDYDVPGVEAFAEMLRVLKPGGRLLCFAGTRTMHRMWCNIEDAGFTIEDTIAWMYGSGFPKHRSKLKPAYEPICVARKPAPKATPLNIDECRIPTDDALSGGGYVDHMHGGNYGNGRAGEKSAGRRYGERGATNMNATPGPRGGDPLGRWPANVVLDEDAARALDEQSGILTSGFMAAGTRRNVTDSVALGKMNGNAASRDTFADSGGASRFFYCAKASRAERDEGLGDMPLRGVGAMEDDTYEWSREAERGRKPRDAQGRNHHPTVKPIELMRWLVRLVTPAGGVVLDPFTGSGTTGIAAVIEGREFVGIEREAEYAEIAERRIKHWLATKPLDLFGEDAA